MITIPDLQNKSELIDWLIENKSALIAQKKSTVKHADAISAICSFITVKGDSAIKADAIPDDATKLKVRSIINTTKIFDSHGDVHIDQLWNKSLKENKDLYLVKEHNFSFEGIISENVKAFTKQTSWNELGFNYSGQTQALIFDSVLTKDDNPMMFDRYKAGRVKQHSVGMRYVKLDLAVNDERYEKEYAIWTKYYDLIVNKNDVDEVGYFWAVTEAKVHEGSAVIKGSNFATPTQSVTAAKGQPSKDTGGEPLSGTRDKGKKLAALNKLLTETKI
jgi:hypothetical protein